MTDEIGGICRAKRTQCTYAREDGYCALNVTDSVINSTQNTNGKMTNGDRIRNMTDEELSKLFNLACWACIYGNDETCDNKDCEQGVMAWLGRRWTND